MTRTAAVIFGLSVILVPRLAAAGTADRESSVEKAAVPAAAKQSPNLPAGPREYLRGLGFDESLFTRFQNGRPLDEKEQEPLLRMLFWLRRLDPLDVGRWAKKTWSAAVKPSPDELFRLHGRLQHLKRLEPPPELVERFELPQYYCATVLLEPDDRPVEIFIEKVPRSWPEGGRPGARVGAEAMFLKFAGPKFTQPVFAAHRLAWYPPTPLGDLGFDYGLFDDVKQYQPYGQKGREAFYQMLAAAGRAKPGAILAAAEKDLAEAVNPLRPTSKKKGPSEKKSPSGLKIPDYCPVYDVDDRDRRQFSVFPLFFEPEGQLGKPFVLEGTARRVEMIRLGEGDRDVIERFHFDHYYEIMLFTDDSGGNPITFCVRQLPPGLPEGSGPGYGEPLRVAGFFYKVWSYNISAEGSAAGPSQIRRQFSPLLIGHEPIWYPPSQPAQHLTLTLVLGAVLVALVALIWIAVWRMNRADRRFFQSRRESSDPSFRENP
ncbi:MAG: hypothetical protein JXB10_10075 [Pirellulales bacterium]|nr:hypothetical protein [Pirellulales bacterium]